MASITTRSTPTQKEARDLNALTTQYTTRTAPYISIDTAAFPTEQALLDHLDKQKTRTTPILIALDSRGKLLTSEEFAAWIGVQRDQGQQSLIFAIGPPDGWSDAARARAALVLSFGRMTLPHQLMRLVLAEQIYRAFTILAGHPYHSGHSG
jgi:23S rRNA (pseudouridine1915-N3)-methyltransferase